MNPYVQYMYSYPHKTAYRSLDGIFLHEYAALLTGKGHGLYLHVPFCQGKCGYCNLFSVTDQDERQMGQYFDAVERQSRQYQKMLEPYGTEFSAFTIGGGTPLLLPERQLERMFAMVKDCFSLERTGEIGIETAPNQTKREKLELLKQAGVTRVSMGIQSFFDEELRVLRRGHRAERARRALEILMNMDFSCVNVDFIYGIPGQTIESLQASLKEAIGFGVDEIFLYPLYVKHGAGLIQEGIVLDPEYAYQQYWEMSEYLQSEGFRQDSMRRFVRKKFGEESRRKFSECGFGTSLALGCGGRSYVGRLHFCTPYTVTQQSCLEQLKRFEETEDFLVVKHGILLSEEEQKRRYVIRHLLIRPGIAKERYREIFGSSLWADFPILERWVEEEWLQIEETEEYQSFLSLTKEGIGLSDYLGPMLISREVSGKMQEWETIYES
ncbi:MAG: coproporphyrinogen III oxidase family protein [Lachnospiraceae bacterium]|nr:coproporphyrinogen III oxidase family protein [Lachnospiraceae bacterium]